MSVVSEMSVEIVFGDVDGSVVKECEPEWSDK